MLLRKICGASSAYHWRCNPWQRPCSPTHPSLKEVRTDTSPTGHISGPIPIPPEAAYRLVGKWSRADCLGLRAAVPKQGLESPIPAGRLRDLARDALAIARDGLRSRAITRADSAEEALYLEPLDAIARGSPVQA